MANAFASAGKNFINPCQLLYSVISELLLVSITVYEEFHRKRVISILVNLRYLRFKLLKYKENNKKICNTFDHNFKTIPLYIMSNVSLERYYTMVPLL